VEAGRPGAGADARGLGQRGQAGAGRAGRPDRRGGAGLPAARAARRGPRGAAGGAGDHRKGDPRTDRGRRAPVPAKDAAHNAIDHYLRIGRRFY